MFRNHSNIRTATCLATLAIGLLGCSGLTQSDQPALRVWWLQPVSAAQDTAEPRPLTLDLDVVPGLDSDEVLALSHDAQLKPYAGARWADNLPELVASLVTRSLHASGRFDVLQDYAAGDVAACELRLELNEFFADLDSAGRTRGVSVDIGGRYQCENTAAHGLKARAYVTVDAEQMNAIVAAFQKALNQVTIDIINQIDIKQ